jgi:predicted  nucleic acid-binding Zn-ribbon protein
MSAMTTDVDRVARLRMDARYHRERRDLYRAKMFSPRATSPERMRELERASEQAAERLRAAEEKVSAAAVERQGDVE